MLYTLLGVAPNARAGEVGAAWQALEVSLGGRSDDVHVVGLGDLGQLVVGHIRPCECSAEIVEVADHRGREVEVELAARNFADPEAMRNTNRDEDERSGRAAVLVTIQAQNPARRSRPTSPSARLTSRRG